MRHARMLHISLVFVLLALLAVPGWGGSASAAGVYPGGATGYDAGGPACGQTLPASYSFGIAGVTNGRAFSQNPCLGAEYAWAAAGGRTPSFYLNLNAPIGTTASNGLTGPKGNCQKRDKACQAYNYGYNAAADAFAYAASLNASASTWWLDVETANSWSSTTSLNALVVQGAADFLHAKTDDLGAPYTVGVYSTQYQWQKITGGYHFNPALPTWVAGAADAATAKMYCANAAKYSFGGGAIWLVQYPGGGFNADYAC